MLTMRLRFYDVALVHVTIQITIIHWWVKDQRATTIWCQEKICSVSALKSAALHTITREEFESNL